MLRRKLHPKGWRYLFSYYMINGELYRAYWDEDYNEALIKESLDFIRWEGHAKQELQKTNPDIMVMLDYKEYLEENLTKNVLYGIIDHTYQSDHKWCKDK